MDVVNDNNCSWINDLKKRSNIKNLNKDKSCDWLIIGAGYTGLSAARKLSELHPGQKIIIVDAQFAGEGASGRNSGYLVDTTLNDGFTSNKELSNYQKKTDIYKLGIDVVKKFIREHQVDCDLNEAGKYFASSNEKDKKKIINFGNTLSKLGFEYNILNKEELSKKLGTDFDGLEMFETFPSARTFPQIIVDGEKIGGYTEFEKLIEKREYFDSDFEEQCREKYGDNLPDMEKN